MHTWKSTPEPSSTADAEIFSAHRLLQNQKSLTKTASPQTQKSSLKPSSTAGVEIFSGEWEIIDENWVAAHTEINTRTSSTADAEIFTAHRLLQIKNHWRKLSPCRPGNQHRNPVLRLTLKSSAHMDYCRIRNLWRKLSPCRTRNHHRIPFLQLTQKSLRHIDYSKIRNH
jgi:hypothetical protein